VWTGKALPTLANLHGMFPIECVYQGISLIRSNFGYPNVALQVVLDKLYLGDGEIAENISMTVTICQYFSDNKV
jgi:hypothetical protein